MTEDRILLPEAPDIPGLAFRHFRGESDYPRMVAAITASAEADKNERADTVEDIGNAYSHLTNCDPYQDMIFPEVNGEVIGYSRGWWQEEPNDGPYLYTLVGFLVPRWRRRGIGRVMLHWMENRLRAIGTAHPPGRPKLLQGFASETEAGLAILLEQEGYEPIRYFHQMVRPTLEGIPDFPLPEGLEVRPARPEHYRAIWEAGAEAFQDHWGYVPPTEEDYQGWLNNTSFFQPHLWQVAWDVASDQVAGQVGTFINQAENEKYNRKRGYTESISVRRPWRRKGLARALIVLSLHAQKDAGMTESTLGVDSENISGATRVYEDCGFRVVKRSAIYRKPL
jgi:GNAT superfamily N-acetyltransferase